MGIVRSSKIMDTCMRRANRPKSATESDGSKNVPKAPFAQRLYRWNVRRFRSELRLSIDRISAGGGQEHAIIVEHLEYQFERI